MLVDAILKPNIMLQFTVGASHGKKTDLEKWAAIRSRLGGSRKHDKLVFVIPAKNFGKFTCVGVPEDLDCYYMTWEDVASWVCLHQASGLFIERVAGIREILRGI